MKSNTEKYIHLLNQLFLVENNWQNVLYVHTPFCLQRCHYCVYSARVPGGRDEIDEFYHRVLPAQIDGYQPVMKNLIFDQVYFGGGTPTIVDASVLESIYTRIPNFENIPVKTTEISPYTVTDQHLDLFHRYGFIYISMGVQTLNPEVLDKENRLYVSREKLGHICRLCDEFNIISNMDLIFYLNSGQLQDLDITRQDLKIVMSHIRPVSLTLHFNYRITKSMEKRKAMILLIRDMLAQYPEYRPVNSLLQESDLEFDVENSAEYRLMRKHQEFYFYMIPKIPKTYTFGNNVLSLGEYREVKPWSNYYYIYTLRDKYLWKEYYKKSMAYGIDFQQTRECLGLPHHNFANTPFFVDEASKEKFKTILKQTGNPYYEFK